jgi:hypothetical protein
VFTQPIRPGYSSSRGAYSKILPSTVGVAHHEVWQVALIRPGPYNALTASAGLPSRGRTGKEYSQMVWTKPEFKVVAVTLEVTAYAGTKK